MPVMAGIVSYGSYVPYRRLKRSAIAAVLGTPGGKGERAIPTLATNNRLKGSMTGCGNRGALHL